MECRYHGKPSLRQKTLHAFMTTVKVSRAQQQLFRCAHEILIFKKNCNLLRSNGTPAKNIHKYVQGGTYTKNKKKSTQSDILLLQLERRKKGGELEARQIHSQEYTNR